MNVKTATTAPAAATAQTRAASAPDEITRMREAVAKVNAFIGEGPGGIFKSVADFMKTLPSSREILANMK